MELAEATDADLVRAWRAGSEAAASALVARHAAAIGRFLHASGAPASELDDLVQETLYRAFVKLESWRGEAGFRSWLLAIAANAQRDQYRRHGKRMVIGLDDADLPDNQTPASELAMKDATESLRRAVARLPRLQREVFLLRTLEALDYPAIAQVLGTTAGAARVHYHAAARRLKEVIA
jgi:RNA polymerase sigma-70 factor (ECF subfamily)